MSNTKITSGPAGGEYQVTGSQRVHLTMTLELSGGPGAGAEFRISLPIAGGANVALERAGSTQQPITFAVTPPDPSPFFTGRTVVVAHGDSGGTRTVDFIIEDDSGNPSTGEDWTLKLFGLALTDTVTVASNLVRATVVRVEADPILDCVAPVPTPAFTGQTVELKAAARRDTLPLPVSPASYPSSAVQLLTWTQTAGPTAPIVAGSLATPGASVGTPAADGFDVTADVVVPALGVATALQYVCTATFGEFTATCAATVQAQPSSFHWLIALDHSKTMQTKWANATTVANLWADLVAAFRGAGAAQDRIGVLTFDDPAQSFRGAAPSSTIRMRWPGTNMAALPAVSDPALDGFRIGGAAVLTTPAEQTPLGDGVIASLKELASGAGSTAGSQHHLLVVSDGFENTGTVKVDPLSAVTGAASATTFDSLKSAGALSALSYGRLGNTHIHPVGTIAPTPMNTTPLNVLGSYEQGPFPLNGGVAELFPTAFGSALFAALGAAQVSIALGVIDNTNFPDPVDVGSGKKVYFLVPAGDDKLVVAVLCDNSARDRVLRLTFRRQMVAAPFVLVPGVALTSVARDQYLLAVVDLTQLGPSAPTEWRVAVDRAGVAQPVAATDVLAGRDLVVRSTITFDKDAYFNDEPMVVRASVFDGVRPVKNAQVTVELEGPAVSEGELLAANPRAAAPPASREATIASDGVPPGSREAALSRVLATRKQTTLPTVQYKAVFIDGSNVLRPDGDSGDGYYANIFTKNWREGRYDFRFTISGRTAGGGAFSDVYRTSRLVRLRIDDASSRVTVDGYSTRAPAGMRAARITVQPADLMGQRLGPFRGDQVAFSTSSGFLAGAVESGFDGSYTQALIYPTSHRPVVTVQVQGRTFTPVLVSHDLVGTITGLVRRALAWLVRFARRG